MTAAASDVDAPFSRRRGGGAVLIALVYSFAGPPIGTLLVFPLAMVAAVQFSQDEIPETATAMLFVLPWGFVFSYVMAGSLALLTGIATASVAYRRGVLSIRDAAMVTTFVFGVFLVVQGFVHFGIPGAALFRGEGQLGPGLWLLISILSSLACWRLTRPLQRRLA